MSRESDRVSSLWMTSQDDYNILQMLPLSNDGTNKAGCCRQGGGYAVKIVSVQRKSTGAITPCFMWKMCTLATASKGCAGRTTE